MIAAEAFLDDRPQAREFRVHNSVFSDPEVFEAEMRYLFEGGWVFLGLESQIPEPHGFLTVMVGRKPVVVMRDGQGLLRAFHNRCPHRGTLLCTRSTGSARIHVCPYHSWSFDSEGRNRGIKGKEQGGYTDAFLAGNHDLTPIAAFGNYRGLLFGSLVADVPPLEQHLGDARMALDLLLDQSVEGIEALPGSVTYLYRGNWKYQLENCSDAYHVTSVHPSYLRLSANRIAAAAAEEMRERGEFIANLFSADSPNGSFSFGRGHALAWASTPVTPAHALFDRSDELAARVGPRKRDWMFYTRNLTIFPNVQFADNFSTQLRILRPIAPDVTEMITYCVGPRDERPDARRQRLRQYEDFFNPTGLATPDDNAVYEDCQAAAGGRPDPDGWLQGYQRGMTVTREGGNEIGSEIGISAERSVLGTVQLADETIFHGYYRTWRERIETGQAREEAAL